MGKILLCDLVRLKLRHVNIYYRSGLTNDVSEWMEEARHMLVNAPPIFSYKPRYVPEFSSTIERYNKLAEIYSHRGFNVRPLDPLIVRRR